MLADIQAIVETHPATTWAMTDPHRHLKLQWDPEFALSTITFERKFQNSPDGGMTLIELWRMAPPDLQLLLKAWGHPDRPDWDDLLSAIPQGTVLANKKTGELVILRDYGFGQASWSQKPFPLQSLPTRFSPNLLGDAPNLENQDEEEESASSFSLFIADLVNEELQDREGAGVRLSKKWRFEGRASRFNPQLRIERRLKFNFDNTYTVFDIYTFELDWLIGDRHFRVEDDYTSEAGLLFEAKKDFVVVRQGYRKWYQALFAPFFSPARLPYNAKKLESLPVGVRIILPTTTGLTLVERYSHSGFAGEDYPLELQASGGTRSVFFISISKRSSTQVDMRFGARIERPLLLELRGRPNFDGPLDPRRLLMGTVVQTRFDRTKGSRIFLQKNVNLEDPQQVKETVEALKRGIRLNGFVLGVGAILNFTFSPKIDTYLLERRLKGKLPDLDWESRIESKYLQKEAYGKVGLRPFSARAQKTEVIDDWQVLNLITGEKTTGKSAAFVFQRNLRLLKYITRRRLQVLALEGQDQSDDQDAHSHYIQILDLFTKSRIKKDGYLKRAHRIQGLLGTSIAVQDAGKKPPEDRWKKMEMGYRLLISDQGLETLAKHLLSPAAMNDYQTSDPLHAYMKRHPLLRRKLRRHQDDRKKRDVLIAKLLYKIARKNGPLFEAFSLLDPADFYLEYREITEGKVLVHGFEGDQDLTKALSNSLKTWEELEVFDDIFIDRSISDRIRR